MNENNKSAPQSCLSISAHQVKCKKNWVDEFLSYMNRSQKSFNQSLFPLIKTKNDTQMSRRDNGELELNVIQFDPFENRMPDENDNQALQRR